MMYRTPGLFRVAALLAAVASVNLTGCSALPTATADPVMAAGEPLPTLAPMLERATPAVVNITTEGRLALRRNPLLDDPFFRRFFDFPEQPLERRVQSLGSGVVVDAGRGYVVTNYHVLDQAEKITVTLRDGRQLSAKAIGADSQTDIAVIQIPAQGLTALPLANSDTLRVGDFVVAIGNPFGLGQTVTSGIVSALGRNRLGIQGYEDFIQTDASINPGNSGGALVNLRGELVGVNTAILTPTGVNAGIGFAIPSNMVRRLIEQLVQYGEVRRGRLGVSVQDLTPELANAFGVRADQGAVVAQVLPESTAAQAGLRSGDVVLAVDGKPVRNAAALRNAIGLLAVGDSIRLNILREGRPLEIVTRLNAVPPMTLPGTRVHPRLAGAVLKDIAPGTPKHRERRGVWVERVERGSAAARAGLRANDVIIGANRQEVTDIQVLQQLAAGGDALLLDIQRGREALSLVLR